MKYTTLSRNLARNLALSTLLLLSWGCATSRDARSPASVDLSEHLSDSQVDISYILGHDNYRIAVEAKDSQVLARSFIDKQILEESKIDKERYSKFLEKAHQFLTHPQASASANSEGCRSPYKVSVRLGTEIKSLQGCRGPDEGALSHLVREGEFLLYSKK